MPLPSMAIEIEAIKLQNQINALPETRQDDPDLETRMSERHALMAELDSTRLRQIAALEKEGIAASEIGRFTPPEDGLKLRTSQGVLDLPRFERDELARFFGS